jgi:hypothetical protein
MIKKPKWLKKADKSKPWKYKKTIFPDGKPLEIDLYNFEISMLGDPSAEEYVEALRWIDEEMKK